MSDVSTTPSPSVAQAREYLRSVYLTAGPAKPADSASDQASDSDSSSLSWLNKTVYDFIFGDSSDSSSSSASQSLSDSSSASASMSDASSSASSASMAVLSDLPVNIGGDVSSGSGSGSAGLSPSSSSSNTAVSAFSSSAARHTGKSKKSHKATAEVPLGLSSTSSSAAEWATKDASISGHASRVSLGRIIGYFLLFVVLSILTVWLVNWFMRRRQRNADDAKADEEMVGFAPRGVDSEATDSTTKVDINSNPSSAASRSTEGNSSRQRFLQSRREAAQRSYGATDQNDADEL